MNATAIHPESYATTAVPTGAVYPRDNVRSFLAMAKIAPAPLSEDASARLATAFRGRRLAEIKPSTVRVGMGATYAMWTDTHACEVVAVSKTGTRITVRAMKATRDESWKPDFHPGGFVGHVSNQNDQRHTLESDPDGSLYTATWSERRQVWQVGGKGGCRVRVHLHQGREFYDYNF